MVQKKKLSTTWSLLNGDEDLSFVQILIYHMLIRVENFLSFGKRVKGAIYYKPKADIRHDYLSNSPARQLCWDFLYSIDFEVLRKRVGDLHVLDIGCGKGNYVQFFDGNGLASYVGVDIAENDAWLKHRNDKTSFMKCNCGVDILQVPSYTNLIFSQSALEHVKYDLSLLNDIAAHVKHREQPIVQIHLLPYRQAIKMYGPHGHRVYNQNTLTKILNLFPSAKAKVYLLGNEDIRKLYYEKYADNRFLNVLLSPFWKYQRDQEMPSTEGIQLQQALAKDQDSADFAVLIIGHNITDLDDLIGGRA